MSSANFSWEFEKEHQGFTSDILLLYYLEHPILIQFYSWNHAVKWSEIHERIRKMIRSVFDLAAAVHPEMHSPYSRAIYGIDVMVDAALNPKLLEVVLTFLSEHH